MSLFSFRKKLQDEFEGWIKKNKAVKNCAMSFVAWLEKTYHIDFQKILEKTTDTENDAFCNWFSKKYFSDYARFRNEFNKDNKLGMFEEKNRGKK